MSNVPPRNLEAERAVIGAVLVENQQFDAIAEIVRSRLLQ
jgi:replicative DNA helicase